MKYYSTAFLLLSTTSTMMAQGVITRIGSDGTHFYYNGMADLQAVFDDATDESPGTDTILFSGGSFLLTADLLITSPVIMIGTGIRSDSSTTYGGRTEFISGGSNRNVTLTDNADATEMHGLSFSMSPGHVRFGATASGDDVDDVKFYRCSFKQLTLGDGGGEPSLANNTLIQQCIISDQLDVNRSNGVLVRNSFVGYIYRAAAGSNTTVQNCILTDWVPASQDGVLYDSNIFLKNADNPLNVSEQAVYTHNLFVGNGTLFEVTFDNGIVEDNTYTANSLAVAFPNAPVPADFVAYEFNKNYTVAPQFVGTNGPVGIYGGDAPWKDGSLPFVPHWTLLSAPANTVNGVLPNVHIKASAQDN